VENLKEDPEILAAVDKGDRNPVDYLQAHLEEMISTLSASTGPLDKQVKDQGEPRLSFEANVSPFSIGHCLPVSLYAIGE
jgi:hypothetical protein